MTPLLRRRGRVAPAGDVPTRTPARQQCPCPVEHGIHVPGECAHSVAHGPALSVGCPCGTRPDSHTSIGGQE